MPFSTISKAISGNVQRSVAISELKHKAKIDDIRRDLAVSQLTRKTHYAEKLLNARTAHATWYAALTEEGKAEYQKAVDDIEAIVNPAPTQD